MTDKQNSFGSFVSSALVPNHVVTSDSNNTKIEICGKEYSFSSEMLKQYPKLLDPSARYTINFDTILPLIYGYSPDVLPNDLLDENSEKTMFLSNCEFFEIKLTDDMILHLSSNLRKDIQDCSEFIQEKAGRKGKEKLRFINRRDVQEWLANKEKAFIESESDVKPLDVIRLLELGGKSLDQLVIHDFKSKNLVFPLIKDFMKSFLERGS